jgi:hypothetical protein
MFQNSSTTYIRIPFEVADPSNLDLLLLNMKYDDGFVAYLNGVEVGSYNAPVAPIWDSVAIDSRSDRKAREYESFNISAFLDLLQAGQNLLSIHGLNSRSQDDDFLILPELIGGVVADVGASESALPYTGPITISGDTVVRARTALGGEWSSLNEAEFALERALTDLRVAEIMYHPADPTATEIAAGYRDADDFEFLELINIGSDLIDLSDIQLTEGVAFDFQSGNVTQLGPGQRVVVVEDLAAFQFRYGTQLSVAGQWSGQLNNGGETLATSDSGNLLQRFVYDDAWYPSTDGGGRSLEIVDVENPDLSSWSDEAAWHASDLGGTPGRPPSIPGDVNHDGNVDVDDIDALVGKIVTGTNEATFDLTGDGIVDQADLDMWLSLAGIQNLPSGEPYLLGDANLDGMVDARDLNVVGQNWLQNVDGWSRGDFWADGRVHAPDLNALGINWLKDVSGRAAAAATRRERLPRSPLANETVLSDRDSIMRLRLPSRRRASIEMRVINLAAEDVDIELVTRSKVISPNVFVLRHPQHTGRLSAAQTHVPPLAEQQLAERVQGRLADLALARW